MHTDLTTFHALRGYRNHMQSMLTVYIKIIPSGAIKKFVVSPSHTVFDLYNMFNGHSEYGIAHSSMIILPTMEGLFELHRELAIESDVMLADTRGASCLLICFCVAFV
jgi:hypothetical protein